MYVVLSDYVVLKVLKAFIAFKCTYTCVNCYTHTCTCKIQMKYV